MASRKAKKAAEKQEDTAALFLARMKDAAQKKLADNPHVHFQDSAKFFDSIYGIPLTGNLILQYLLGVDVLALGRCLTLVGEPGAHKSEFGWYLAKLMARAGGLVQFIDTENKSNTDQIDAVFQDHELFLSNVNPVLWFTWIARNVTKVGCMMRCGPRSADLTSRGQRHDAWIIHG